MITSSDIYADCLEPRRLRRLCPTNFAVQPPQISRLRSPSWDNWGLRVETYVDILIALLHETQVLSLLGLYLCSRDVSASSSSREGALTSARGATLPRAYAGVDYLAVIKLPT